MDDNDLTELARGVVPFVHEAIAEALAKRRHCRRICSSKLKRRPRCWRNRHRRRSNAVTVMPDISGEIEKAFEKIRRPTRFDITRAGELAVSYSDGTNELLGPGHRPARRERRTRRTRPRRHRP